MTGNQILDFVVHLSTAEFPVWQTFLAIVVVSTIVRKL